MPRNDLERKYLSNIMINKIEENKTYTDSNILLNNPLQSFNPSNIRKHERTGEKEKLKVQVTSILFLKHCIDIHPNKN